MLETVTEPGGTGVKASVKGYRIAAKTGTTKKININGKYENKYISYIVGLAPVSNPKFSLMIMISEPQSKKYYGGDTAAPIFKQIMKNILKISNVKPDAL